MSQAAEVPSMTWLKSYKTAAINDRLIWINHIKSVLHDSITHKEQTIEAYNKHNPLANKTMKKISSNDL